MDPVSFTTAAAIALASAAATGGLAALFLRVADRRARSSS
jgi:hypothetical protein